MTKREAKRLAYMVVSTELRILVGWSKFYKYYPKGLDDDGRKQLSRAIEEIIHSLAQKGE